MMKKYLSVLLAWSLCAVCLHAAWAESAEITWDDTYEPYKVNDVLIAYHTMVLPCIKGMENTEAMERVNAAIHDFAKEKSGFDRVCEYAREAYESDPAMFSDPNRDAFWAGAIGMWGLHTETLLSVRFDFETDTGGPHPWQSIAVRHYDLRTGEPVALESLVRDSEALRALVVGEINRWISESGFEAFEDADAGTWTPERGLLTAKGLFVFMNKGELGPVSAGAVELVIPYERLGDAFTVDTAALQEAYAPQDLIEQTAELYVDYVYSFGDKVIDFALLMDPGNPEAYLARAEGHLSDYDLLGGDLTIALEALEAAEQLAGKDPRYNRLLAEALYLRADEQFDDAPDFGNAQPGDEVYEIYRQIFHDLERSIALDPTNPYTFQKIDAIAYAMGLSGDEGGFEFSDDIREILSFIYGFGDYWSLHTFMNVTGKLDAAADVLAVWKEEVAWWDDEEDEEPDDPAPAYERAEDAYEAGAYEEAIGLYREAVEAERENQKLWNWLRTEEPDIFPQRLWYRLTDAYMKLARYDEAAGVLDEVKAWYPENYENISLVIYNQCAEALLAANRPSEAREVFLDFLETWVWNYEAAEELLAQIDAMLPQETP